MLSNFICRFDIRLIPAPDVLGGIVSTEIRGGRIRYDKEQHTRDYHHNAQKPHLLPHFSCYICEAQSFLTSPALMFLVFITMLPAIRLNHSAELQESNTCMPPLMSTITVATLMPKIDYVREL